MSDLAHLMESVVARVPLERSPFGIRAPIGRLAAVDQIVRRQVFRRMLGVVARSDTAVRGRSPSNRVDLFGWRCLGVHSHGPRCRIEGPWLVLGVAPDPVTPTVELGDGVEWGPFRFRYERSEPHPVRMSHWRFVTKARPLLVRGAHPDDVIAIRDGSKSVVEAIRERGYPPSTHPVVTDTEGNSVWIPGVRHAWMPVPERAPGEIGYLVIVVDQESPWAPFEP